MGRCIIITSWQSAKLKDMISFEVNDFILCADGGYTFAEAEHIVPHVVIGDFDSCDEPAGGLPGRPSRVLRVPAEKDDTDTMLCLKYGIKKGYQEFVILGGLGGRLDHTIANLQAMAYAVDLDLSIKILDGKNIAAMIGPGEMNIDRKPDYKLSLFAFSEMCTGLTIKGVKYPLDHTTIRNTFPIGTSNEFIEDKASISLSSGMVLIILSKD